MTSPEGLGEGGLLHRRGGLLPLGHGCAEGRSLLCIAGLPLGCPCALSCKVFLGIVEMSAPEGLGERGLVHRRGRLSPLGHGCAKGRSLLCVAGLPLSRALACGGQHLSCLQSLHHLRQQPVWVAHACTLQVKVRIGTLQCLTHILYASLEPALSLSCALASGGQHLSSLQGLHHPWQQLVWVVHACASTVSLRGSTSCQES